MFSAEQPLVFLSVSLLIVAGMGLVNLFQLANSELAASLFWDSSIGIVLLGVVTFANRAPSKHVRQNEQRLRTVLQEMPVMLNAFDERGNLIVWNKECERVTGYFAAEVVGDLAAMAQMYPNAAYRQQMLNTWVQRSNHYRDWEWDITCKDGSVRTIAWSNIADEFPVEGWATWGIGIDVTQRKQAELALHQANERFRLAAAAVNSVIYDWDLKRNQIERTEGMSRLFEFSSDEIEPTSEWWLQRIHPDDLYNVKHELAIAFENSDRYHLEYRVRHKCDRYIYVSDQGLILRDELGKPIRIVGSVVDISERAQLEAERQQSEAIARARAVELETFMQTVPVAVWIAHDPECTQVTVNQAAYEMMRRSSGAVMTATPANGEYPFQFKIQQNGQEIATSDLPMQQAGRTGEAASGEFEFVFDDGDICYLYGKAVPLWNENQEVRGVIGAFLDITTLKQTNTALRESQERLTLALDAAKLGYWDWDMSTDEVLWSPYHETLFGYEPGTPMRTYEEWASRVHADDRDRVESSVLAAMVNRQRYQAEYRVVTANGEVRWVSGSGRFHYDSAGIPTRMLGVLLDISDQRLVVEERAQALERERAARMELERANRMKDEFLAIVSHELRSPLNAILGWARLLRTRTFDPQRTEQALASIERNAQAQTQLIEDLLDISRIIRGTIRLNLCPTDLATCVQAAIDTISPNAHSKSIHLDAKLDPGIGVVSGDPDRLQQIVWNLLSNAIKFTPDHGRVEIRLTQDQTNAYVQVMDTGKGIAPDFLPYVFDRFRQADATTTRTQGGLGLGLAIVRNLVELHGGSIDVISEGANQGSTFTVTLPLLFSSIHSGSRHLLLHRQTVLDTPLNLSGLKILAVDDEADTREFLKTALEQYGAEVAIAASAEEAFQLVQTLHPDVLLSDIGMPHEDGYAFMQRVRSLPPEQGGQVPAAALTAYVREGDRLLAIAAGFQMHIPKPIEPIQLLTVIVQLTGSK